jgi:hypothetical protein
VSSAAQLRAEAADYYQTAAGVWREATAGESTPERRQRTLGDVVALASLSQAASSLAIAVDLETRVPRPIQLNASAVPFGASEPVTRRGA